MKLIEFRIPVPLTIDQYQIGELYTIAESSKQETGGGQGVTVELNRPFENEPLFKDYHQGQFTKKTYHIEKKIAPFWRKFFPKTAWRVDEESWNALPYCKTVVTNKPVMGDRFEITSLHLPNNGCSENVFELDKNDLKNREVCVLDICSDKYMFKNEKQSLSLRNVEQNCKKHAAIQIPTELNWYQRPTSPIMCAYKLLRVKFDQYGMQRMVETMVANTYPKLIVRFHRQMLVWHSKWCCLTVEKMREVEKDAQQELQKLIGEGGIRGLTEENDDSEKDNDKKVLPAKSTSTAQLPN